MGKLGRKKLLKIKRVVLVATLFFYVPLMFLTTAATTVAATASADNSVKRAENYLLKGERLKALRALQSLKSSSANEEQKKDIEKKISRYATQFLTEKAQADFEKGKTLAEKDFDQAIESLLSVYKKEPYNTAVLKTIGRVYLSVGKCAQAEEFAQNSLKVIALDAEAELLSQQALVCEQKFKNIPDNVSQADPNRLFKLLVLAQKHYFLKNYKKALQFTNQAMDHDPQYPETYYWRVQILEHLEKPFIQSAQKYVRLCKGHTLKKEIKYRLEPRLCQEYKQMEEKLESVDKNEE